MTYNELLQLLGITGTRAGGLFPNQTSSQPNLNPTLDPRSSMVTSDYSTVPTSNFNPSSPQGQGSTQNLPPNFSQSKGLMAGGQSPQQGILGNINQFMMNPATALAIGLLQPTKGGTFGEALGGGYQNLMAQNLMNQKLKQQQFANLLGVGQLQAALNKPSNINYLQDKKTGKTFAVGTVGNKIVDMQTGKPLDISNLQKPQTLSSAEKNFQFFKDLPQNKGLSDQQILNKHGDQIFTAGTNVAIDMSKNQPKYLDSFNLEYDTQFIKDSTPKFRGLNQTFGRLNRIGEILNEEEVFVGPFAEGKKFLARLGTAIGFGEGQEALNKTSELIQGLAKGQLEMAALLEGQGVISDSERVIIQRAADGDTSFTKGELQTLNTALKKVVKEQVKTIQEDVGNITQRLKDINQPVIDEILDPSRKRILQKQLNAQIDFLNKTFQSDINLDFTEKELEEELAKRLKGK